MAGPSSGVKADLWTMHGKHAALLFQRGPAFVDYHRPASFAVLSGASHVDLNQAALFDGAGRVDVLELLELAGAAAVPIVLARSLGASDDVVPFIREAGFERLQASELLFSMDGVPGTRELTFEVRRIATGRDVAAMQEIFLDVHGYGPELTGPMFGDAVIAAGPTSGWLAWDGDEAVSCAFVTRADGALGLWEVMTPERHRRRGAGRAVVCGALERASRLPGPPIARTVLWASPAGRPLYERAGFSVADEFEVWTRGASLEDLAAVGAG